MMRTYSGFKKKSLTKEDLYAKIAKLENRIKELETSNKLRGGC